MPTNEEMALATFANEFPRLAKEVEREEIHGSFVDTGIRYSELRDAYVAGYLRAIKERE